VLVVGFRVITCQALAARLLEGLTMELPGGVLVRTEGDLAIRQLPDTGKVYRDKSRARSKAPLKPTTGLNGPPGNQSDVRKEQEVRL
jgi:hypothetical protein